MRLASNFLKQSPSASLPFLNGNTSSQSSLLISCISKPPSRTSNQRGDDEENEAFYRPLFLLSSLPRSYTSPQPRQGRRRCPRRCPRRHRHGVIVLAFLLLFFFFSFTVVVIVVVVEATSFSSKARKASSFCRRTLLSKFSSFSSFFLFYFFLLPGPSG